MTKGLLAAALALLAFIAGTITTQEKPVADQFGSDPITDLARNAHGQAVTPNRLNALERRMRALERFGRVDGMVFRTKYAEALGEVSTTSASSFVDLGGPSVTIKVPEGGGLVEVYVEVDAKRASGDLKASITGADLAFPVQIVTATVSSYITLASGNGGSGGFRGQGNPVRFYVPTAGEQTLTVEYELGAVGTPTDPAYFKNRRLWVGVARAGT